MTFLMNFDGASFANGLVPALLVGIIGALIVCFIIYKKKVNSEVWGDESGTGTTVGEQTNLSRIDIIQAQVGTLSAKLDGIEDGAEKNFISSVDEEKFTVTDGKLVLNENYVTTAIYTAEVGDLTQLIRDEGRVNTTLVDEINYINERYNIWMQRLTF